MFDGQSSVDVAPALINNMRRNDYESAWGGLLVRMPSPQSTTGSLIIRIRPGISRIVDDAKDAAVGQRPPCDLPIPCASISPLGERKIVFGEIPDNTIGASGCAECPEQGGKGMLYPFIRIHDGPATGIIDIANRQREA